MSNYDPSWFFMQHGGRRGRRNRNQQHQQPPQGYSMAEYLDDMRDWMLFQEEQEKKRKDAEKEKKKPPTPAESIFSFVQWLAIMAFIGLPVGLVTLKAYNSLFKWALE